MVQDLLDFSFLGRLTQAFGPSGNEQEVAAVIRDEVKPFVREIRHDPLGNLLVGKPGQGKKIMIACHMDEVGVMVTGIDEKGFLFFAPVGGVGNASLLGSRVRFGNGRAGIIAQEKKPSGQEKAPAKYYIDIGAATAGDARSLVAEGDMAVLAGEYCETDRYIISKSLDNRVGCFLAVEAIKRLSSKHDLYFAFTAQEEVGARGAKTAAYTVRPDLALVIDATISYDTLKESGQTGLERGVALKAMDRSIVVSPKIKNWLAQTALEKDIPYQWEVISTGGTDSGPIHLTGEGIPTGGLAIPVRYLHTANEMAAKDDIRAAFRLLAALLGGESYPDLEQEVPSRP